MSAELLVGYEAAVGALLAEVEATRAGDRVALSVYLIEPGVSSERVLSALRAAALRGVAVEVALDATPASALSRLVERTGTLLPRALAIAAEVPGFRVEARKTPDHAKHVVLRRPGDEDSALFGGVNLGDRFRSWRDFAVRVRGAAAANLARAVAGEGRAAAWPPPDAALRFVANVPAADRWEVRPVLEALTADPAVARLEVAMAYLDRTGAALLRRALDRGARVELLLPAEANVYQHANMLALEGLLAAGGDLAVRLHPAMVHAKALLARRRDAPPVALLGSANLKRNSFRLFAELDALVTEGAFTAALGAALADLRAEAEPAAAPRPYVRARALVEERLG